MLERLPHQKRTKISSRRAQTECGLSSSDEGPVGNIHRLIASSVARTKYPEAYAIRKAVSEKLQTVPDIDVDELMAEVSRAIKVCVLFSLL